MLQRRGRRESASFKLSPAPTLALGHGSARTCGVISSHLAGHQLTLRLLVSNTKLQQRHHPYTDMTRDSRQSLSGHHLATQVWRVEAMRAMQQLTLLRCQGRCGAGWLMVAGAGNGEDSIRHDLVSMVR